MIGNGPWSRGWRVIDLPRSRPGGSSIRGVLSRLASPLKMTRRVRVVKESIAPAPGETRMGVMD